MAFSIQSLKTVTECGDVGTALDIQQLGIFNLLGNDGDSSFLQIACQNQQGDMVDLILAQPGIIVDYQNASGNSALHDAVRQNHPEIVIKLFKAGASPNLRTADRGETPLMLLIRLTIEKQLPHQDVTVDKNFIPINMETIKNLPIEMQEEVIEQYQSNGMLKTEEKINYQLLDLLFDHPDLDLSIEAYDANKNKINMIDYLITSKYEDHQLMEYLLTKLQDKKINLNLVDSYNSMLRRGCGCGNHSPPGSIYYLEDLLRMGYTPDIEGQKFYFWIIKKLKNHPKKDQVLKLVNQYVDRSNIYQENPNPNSCSILEILLENQDFETIRKLHQENQNLAVNRICRQHGCTPFQNWFNNISRISLESFKEVYQLMVKELSSQWPIINKKTKEEIESEAVQLKKQLTEAVAILFAENVSEGKVSDFVTFLIEMAEYYDFDLEEMKEPFRQYLVEMGGDDQQVENLSIKFLELVGEKIIPFKHVLYPKIRETGISGTTNSWWKAIFFSRHRCDEHFAIFQYLLDQTSIQFDSTITSRAEKINYLTLGTNIEFVKYLILKLKDNLVVNQDEFVSHEPIENIPAQDFIILSNGVVWDQNNLIGYILNIAKGINKFDQHIPIKNLRGQPIWSHDDYTNIFENRRDYNYRNDDEHSMVNQYIKLVDYLNFSKYSKYFTPYEKESLRRFTSIFWARGAWWDMEIKKVLSPDHLKEWEKVKANIGSQGMPRTSEELHHHLSNLKARYLHLFRDFYYGLSDQTKNAMEKLNSMVNERYTTVTIEGNECIMCYGQSLAKLLTKLELDLNTCQPQIIKDFIEEKQKNPEKSLENDQEKSLENDQEKSLENDQEKSLENNQEKSLEDDESVDNDELIESSSVFSDEDESDHNSSDEDESYNLRPEAISYSSNFDTFEEKYETGLPHLLTEIPYDSYY